MTEDNPTTALVTGGAGFIGFHVCKELLGRGYTVHSIDLSSSPAPQVTSHIADLMDAPSVREVLGDISPDVVIHLAARTDTNSNDVDDYFVNVEGAMNVFQAVLDYNVPKLVHASTQYVASPGADVSNPISFSPFTAYGESKAQSEIQLRELFPDDAQWAIVRPTNIWGPRHPRYPEEFWRVLLKGRYVHPGNKEVTRTYGYVENVAWQIAEIVDKSWDVSSGQVIYLGDHPIKLLDWVDSFSRAITGRSARRVPASMVKALALFGDVLAKVGIKWPITSSRYTSMTSDYVVPVQATFDKLGVPPYSMEEGVTRTVAWLKQEVPEYQSIPMPM